MTQEYYQKAMRYAGEKHHNQTVKNTKANYLLHISNVAMEVLIAYQNDPCFNLNLAVQLAILHDTIEDTEATFEEIKQLFGDAVANGVLALTKNEGLPKEEQMDDSLERINLLEKEVGLVKLADRITNLQNPPGSWDRSKIESYWLEAKKIASKLANKNPYLNTRLINKVDEYRQYFE